MYTFQRTKQNKTKTNKLLAIGKKRICKVKELVSIMERPHHLRLLHYRDERVIPGLQHFVNPWAKGDEWCRQRRPHRKAQVVQPSENKSPPRGRKRKRKSGGRLISKVLIVHRFKFTTKTKLQPFPNHDTYAGVFRQAPGRTSFPRPGWRPRR